MLPSKGLDTPFLASPDTLETQRTEHPFSFQTSKDEQLNAVMVRGSKASLERLSPRAKRLYRLGSFALELLCFRG